MGREDEIRVIAYTIWEEDGCCEGHDVEHWLMAETIWQGKQSKATATPSPVKAPAKQKAGPSSQKTTAKRRHNAAPKK
jgi:hypothetical protein